MKQNSLSYLILRKENITSDWRLAIKPKERNNGRNVCVNEIYPTKEVHASIPEWKPGPEDGKTPVIETGYGGIEVATFTHHAGQDCHKHLIGTEIYTVLEGTMQMRLEEKEEITLNAGDELIVFPDTVHEVLSDSSPFLVRVHSINCHGERDKYVKKDGKWCQAAELKK